MKAATGNWLPITVRVLTETSVAPLLSVTRRRTSIVASEVYLRVVLELVVELTS